MSKMKIKDVSHLLDILDKNPGSKFSIGETNNHRGRIVYMWKLDEPKLTIRIFDSQTEKDLDFENGFRKYIEDGILYHILENKHGETATTITNKDS